MQHVKPKWIKSGLVLVCQKCSEERIPDEDPDIARQIGDFDLRDWLKTKLKEDGHWGRVRAISTSCLDICARGRVTVSIVPNAGEAETFVVDVPCEKKALYERIVERLGKQ